MKRLLIIIAALAPTTACVATTHGRLGARAGETPMAADAPRPEPAAGGEPGGPSPDEDEHWFTAEDYLVSQHPYEGRPRTFIKLGKMMTPPSEGTKAEGRFLMASGREVWSPHFWRTRVAVEADLSLGAMAFCPQAGGRLPDDKSRARAATWVLGLITDVSDLYKGSIAIGRWNCEVRGVRVPIR